MDPDIKLVDWHFAKYEVLITVLIMLTVICLFKMFYPRLPYIPNYLPQSIVLILVGVAFGAVLRFGLKHVLEETMWVFTPDVFFNYLLPPIILDAAYNLYNRTFIDILGSVLAYAVVGTILNFLIIGPLVYGLHRCGAMGDGLPDIPINAYLLFASLIVAVDPVAVLAIFQEIGVDLGLYYAVFGESLLNDAVTVVLYEIMKEFIDVQTVTPTAICLGFGSFFTISFGGLLIGFVFGIIASVLTRWKSHFESIIVILLPYFAYILTNCLGWSGIIAIIGCGIVEAAYAFQNIKAKSLSALRSIVRQSAEISEGVIFYLIGIQMVSAEIEWHTGFCLWSLVACLVARAVVVLSISALLNFFKVNNTQIRYREQVILIYGGLRGAVCLSLAFIVEHDRLGVAGQRVKHIIVTGTLFIILFTVGFMGLTIKPLVRLFHVRLAEKEQISIFLESFNHVLDHTMAGVEVSVGARGRNRFREWFTHIDDKFIRKMLLRDPDMHDEKIVKTFEKLALKLHFAAIYATASEEFPQAFPVTLINETTVENSLILASQLIPSDEQEMEDEQSMIFTDSRKRVKLWMARSTVMDPYHGKNNFSEAYFDMMRRKPYNIQRRHSE